MMVQITNPRFLYAPPQPPLVCQLNNNANAKADQIAATVRASVEPLVPTADETLNESSMKSSYETIASPLARSIHTTLLSNQVLQRILFSTTSLRICEMAQDNLVEYRGRAVSRACSSWQLKMKKNQVRRPWGPPCSRV